MRIQGLPAFIPAVLQQAHQSRTEEIFWASEDRYCRILCTNVLNGAVLLHWVHSLCAHAADVKGCMCVWCR